MNDYKATFLALCAATVERFTTPITISLPLQMSPEPWVEDCGYMINASWRNNTGGTQWSLHRRPAQPHHSDKDLFMLCLMLLTLPRGLRCVKHSFFSVSPERRRETSFFPFFLTNSPSASPGTVGGGPGLLEWNPGRSQTLPSSQQTASVFQRVHPAVSVAFRIEQGDTNKLLFFTGEWLFLMTLLVLYCVSCLSSVTHRLRFCDVF